MPEYSFQKINSVGAIRRQSESTGRGTGTALFIQKVVSTIYSILSIVQNNKRPTSLNTI